MKSTNNPWIIMFKESWVTVVDPEVEHTVFDGKAFGIPKMGKYKLVNK